MQYVTLGDTVYLYLAVNTPGGDGVDGDVAGTGTGSGEPTFDVREGGASQGAAPTYSGWPVLLTHANYPPGCYEVAVPATTPNGFSANKTYAVFSSLTVSSLNPTGYLGSFRTAPAPANVKAVADDDSSAANLSSMLNGTGGVDLTLRQLRLENTYGPALFITNSSTSVAPLLISAGGFSAVQIYGTHASEPVVYLSNVGGGPTYNDDVLDELAGAVLGSSVSLVEGTAAEHSLCTIILAGLESSLSGTTWTIKKTDGTTTYLTKTVTTSSTVDPITGVS